MDDQARRVAAELHDGAMQEITLARLQLDLLCADVVGDPGLVGELAELSELLEDATNHLRALMRSLTPDGLGIVQTSR